MLGTSRSSVGAGSARPPQHGWFSSVGRARSATADLPGLRGGPAMPQNGGQDERRTPNGQARGVSRSGGDLSGDAGAKSARAALPARSRTPDPEIVEGAARRTAAPRG